MAEYFMTSFWAAGLAEGIPQTIFWALIAILVILAIAGVAYYFRSPAHIDLRQVAGSRIALAVGDRFAPSDRFTGFVHEKSGASIVLMELPPAAFDEIKLGNVAETFTARGVLGVEQQSLSGRHGDYIYLRGEQNTPLVDYAKYILIFRESGVTGVVTANIPVTALTSGLITGAEIERIFKSAKMKASAPKPPKPLTLSYLGPFEEDPSLLGTAKVYRLKSALPGAEASGLAAMFLVAPSLTGAPIPDLQLFAERAFDGIDQIRDKVVETMHELEIAGLHAVEVLGKGIDVSSGVPALVYQLVVEARHGGHFRFIGLAPESGRAHFLQEFRRIADSFRPAE
jgi:hypothetical protein